MQKKGAVSAEQKKDVEEMQRNILKRKAQLHEIEQTLPQKNSAYLKVSKTTWAIAATHTQRFMGKWVAEREIFGSSALNDSIERQI